MEAARRRSADDRLVHLERLPARPARAREPGAPAARAGRRAAAGRPALGRTRPTAIDLARAGRSVAVATGTASGKSLCYQVPIAEAVRAATRAGTALLLFPTKALAQDQLRSLGDLDVPGLVAACLRRRHRPRGAGVGPAPRQRRAHQPRHAPRRPAPAPRPLGRRSSCGCATSWSTSCTRSGASSAPTSPTSCAGCAGCARTTARDPTFVFGSATIGEPGRLAVGAVRARRGRGDRRRLAPRRAALRPLEPAAARRARPGARASANGETAALLAELVGARLPHASPSAAAARAPSSSPPTPAPACGRRRWPARSAPTAAATSPPSAGRSRHELFAGASGASWPPAPSSSASTSAASTPACSTASPAPSPRCGSRRAGPGGRSSGRSPCSWPATTSSTSGSWPTPSELFSRPPEPAVVNPSNPFVLAAPPRLRRLRAAAHARRRRATGATTSTRACAASCSTTALAVRGGRAVLVGPGLAGVGRSGCAPARPTSTASPTHDGAPRRHGRREPGLRRRCTRAPSTSTRARR